MAELEDILARFPVPTLAERKHVWMDSYAHNAFVQVVQYIQAWRDRGDATTDVDSEAFTTAIITAYNRPFAQKPPVQLPDSLVPPDFKTLHKVLLEARHKILAHRDVRAQARGLKLGFANALEFRFADGRVKFGTLTPHLSSYQVESLEQLMDYLISHLQERMLPFFKSYLHPLPIEGSFELNLAEDERLWLSPSTYRGEVFDYEESDCRLGKLFGGDLLNLALRQPLRSFYRIREKCGLAVPTGIEPVSRP